jgi:hypothetical protein
MRRAPRESDPSVEIVENYRVYRFHPRIAVSLDSRIDTYGRRLLERDRSLWPGMAKSGG